jgi:plastocyanin
MKAAGGARMTLVVATIALAIAGIAGCGPTLGSSSTGAVVAEPGSPAITAHNTTFDRAELVVPAGRAFTLVFDNQDGGPHNVAIYRDQTAQVSLFVGQIFGGPASRVYSVPPLAAGTWFFRCDVHTDMHGTVVAR